MIARVIAFSARNTFLILLLIVAIVGAETWAISTTPLDAIPDLSDVQVIVATDWEDRSPNIIEDQITYPLVTQLLSAPKVKAVRATSFYGSSLVYVIFDPHERDVVAHHEMGHALVAMSIPGVDPVQKISIIPRGIGALGYTIQRPLEDRFLMDRKDLMTAVGLLMARSALSQMDVPTRASYVKAVVSPEERPAAASVTSVPKTFAWASGSIISGYLLTPSGFGWPLLIEGAIKAGCDILLLSKFCQIRPPEEQPSACESADAPPRISRLESRQSGDSQHDPSRKG